ncbi:hypothetical protein DIPPA_09885 [Diplonema papillatum]|nr:hypothetical protein DIPPA_09885 [Diplonema papillatum]|eukprot:gene21559-33169_t
MADGVSVDLKDPARKVFIQQLRDMQGGRWETFTEHETKATCFIPVLGNSCSAAARLKRVWVQGYVAAQSENGASVISDGTASISFVFGDSAFPPPPPGSYCQVVGLLTTPQQDGVFTILAESCSIFEEATKADQIWSAEVFEFQARYVFLL